MQTITKTSSGQVAMLHYGESTLSMHIIRKAYRRQPFVRPSEFHVTDGRGGKWPRGIVVARAQEEPFDGKCGNGYARSRTLSWTRADTGVRVEGESDRANAAHFLRRRLRFG